MSQLIEIQRHLAKGKRLTRLEALKLFGCINLPGRAWDLKRVGWPVRVRTVELANGKHVAEYSFDRRRRVRN